MLDSIINTVVMTIIVTHKQCLNNKVELKFKTVIILVMEGLSLIKIIIDLIILISKEDIKNQ